MAGSVRSAVRVAADWLAGALHTAEACAPVMRYVVEGPSMEPAFRAGERLLVSRVAYLRRAPAAGDAVVLRDPERPGRYLLKRIAAPAAGQPVRDGGAAGPMRFFVLGDNAAVSRDSRAFGSVTRAQIVGRVWRRY
ncbi:MAG: S26 family signal peptidase [Dehalococcoidia bacterium]